MDYKIVLYRNSFKFLLYKLHSCFLILSFYVIIPLNTILIVLCDPFYSTLFRSISIPFGRCFFFCFKSLFLSFFDQLYNSLFQLSLYRIPCHFPMISLIVLLNSSSFSSKITSVFSFLFYLFVYFCFLIILYSVLSSFYLHITWIDSIIKNFKRTPIERNPLCKR